jgi:hypothetical protein
LKWPGVGQNELAGGPEVLLKAALLPNNFSQGAIPLPNFFAPIFIWAEAAGPSMAMPRLKCGERCSALGQGHFQFRMVFAGNGS